VSKISSTKIDKKILVFIDGICLFMTFLNTFNTYQHLIVSPQDTELPLFLLQWLNYREHTSPLIMKGVPWSDLPYTQKCLERTVRITFLNIKGISVSFFYLENKSHESDDLNHMLN
jgi:hypothetical protein